MPYVTIAEAKEHLLMFHDHDDAYINGCIEAAEDYVAQYMGREAISDDQDWRLVESDEESESEATPQKVPAAVTRAILLVVGDLYAHRSATVIGSTVTKHPAVEQMLHPYRKGLGV